MKHLARRRRAQREPRSAAAATEPLQRLVGLIRDRTGNVIPPSRQPFLEEVAQRRAEAKGLAASRRLRARSGGREPPGGVGPPDPPGHDQGVLFLPRPAAVGGDPEAGPAGARPDARQGAAAPHLVGGLRPRRGAGDARHDPGGGEEPRPLSPGRSWRPTSTRRRSPGRASASTATGRWGRCRRTSWTATSAGGASSTS